MGGRNLILFEGNGILAADILRRIIENHNQKACDVLVNYSAEQHNPELITFCNNRKIECGSRGFDPTFVEQLNHFGVDQIISIKGRRIIPIDKINCEESNTFNYHPSLLPRFRGCYSVPWAIINGQEITGYTLHQITMETDKGAILDQKKVGISDRDTAFSLYAKIDSEFCSSFDGFYRKFLRNELGAMEQDSGGEYFGRELPYGGKINLSWSRTQIERFIRAMSFPPHRGAELDIRGQTYEVSSYSDIIKLTEDYENICI